MAYLHDHGIVHRDLKPANLFMEEGIVKIGDYGLAKLITPSQGTEHSESIGTCHYMAPEIASGKYHKPIDIYAIGVILYEMLTGRVPFEGETVGEVLMKHLTARPDLSMLAEPYRTIVGPGPGQGPEPAAEPGLRPAAARGRAAGRRRSGSSARARRAAPRPEPPAVRSARRTRRSCGSRPRSRSSTSAPTRGRPDAQGPNLSAAAPGQLAGPADGLPAAPRNGGSPRPGASAQQSAAHGAGRPQAAPSAGRRRRAARRQCAACGRARRRSAHPPRRRNRRHCPAAGSASPSWPPRCSGPPRSWRCWPSRPPPPWASTRPSDPQQLAYLYGMALLGTWTALIPNKVVETRRLDRDRPPADRPGRRVARRRRRRCVLARALQLDLGLQARVLRATLGTSSPFYFAAPVRDPGRLVVPDGPRPQGAVPHHADPLDRRCCRRRSSRSGPTSGRTASPSRP